jgi:hypothetical protein
MVWLGGARGFGYYKDARVKKPTKHAAEARKPDGGPAKPPAEEASAEAQAQGPVDCPKCKAAMEEGFALNYAPGSAVGVAFWLRGPLEFTRWRGRLNLKGKKGSPMKAYRCPSCGYVEIYAR